VWEGGHRGRRIVEGRLAAHHRFRGPTNRTLFDQFFHVQGRSTWYSARDEIKHDLDTFAVGPLSE
jgi:hypothetical protein